MTEEKHVLRFVLKNMHRKTCKCSLKYPCHDNIQVLILYIIFTQLVFKNVDKHAIEILVANVHPNIRKLMSTEIPARHAILPSIKTFPDKTVLQHPFLRLFPERAKRWGISVFR